jgi:hypothetical protein
MAHDDVTSAKLFPSKRGSFCFGACGCLRGVHGGRGTGFLLPLPSGAEFGGWSEETAVGIRMGKVRPLMEGGDRGNTESCTFPCFRPSSMRSALRIRFTPGRTYPTLSTARSAHDGSPKAPPLCIHLGDVISRSTEGGDSACARNTRDLGSWRTLGGQRLNRSPDPVRSKQTAIAFNSVDGGSPPPHREFGVCRPCPSSTTSLPSFNLLHPRPAFATHEVASPPDSPRRQSQAVLRPR